VRQERAAGRRSCDDIRLRDDLAWQDVEEILGQTPDRRRMQKELMRVQIHATVKAVSIIEVPVAHQHFQILQRLERLIAHPVLSCHVEWPLLSQ